MIVDAHAHLGYDFVFERDFPLNELLIAQKENGIEVFHLSQEQSSL